MKKTLCIILAAVISLLSLVSCDTEKAEGTYRIGICNYVDDASLNQIVEAMEARLEEIGAEKGVTFKIDYQNCNADSGIMAQIISNFIVDGADLMVGVATPVAMQMQAATEDNEIPVVFAAVSDPVGAKLVDSNEKPGHNITGTSDYLDAEAIMNLILVQNPGIKKVGLLYDVGQDSSTAAIESARNFLFAKGISVIEYTGTNAEEILLAANSLVADGAEAVFTPTDNTIMNAELAIYSTFADAKIPHYCGADSFALNGAFLGYGVDYENLGRETAEMIAEILLEGKNPGDMSVRTFDNGTATVNTDICSALGIDYDTIAAAFAPYCTAVKKITTAKNFSDLAE